MMIKWIGFDDDENMTWETLDNICDELSGILEEFLGTPGEGKLKCNIIDLYLN